MRLQQAVLLVAAAVALAASPLSAARHFFDDVGAVKQHSFHPPLLEDYIESGFHAWSFGASAVVTNDYVRLTPAAHEGHGYLWNHYHAELSAFRAHFSLRLNQRPHHGLFGNSACETCGVAMWALKEPVRHGEQAPFFGVPHHFSGIGVVVHQDGVMHLVAKESAESAASTLDDVTLGHCTLNLETQQVDILLDYHTHERRMELSYRPPGGTATTCVRTEPTGLPDKYYFGFTAFARAASPVGYEVVGMMVVPVDHATERPIDAAEEQRAKEFDRTLDSKEREFWHEGQPDADPRKAYMDEVHKRKPDHARDDASAAGGHHQQRHHQQQQHQPPPPPGGDDLMDDAAVADGTAPGNDDGSDGVDPASLP
eukprot:CAMPEP_0174880850 /NCGR_PEP_ID=MMETSP1114-20130205/83968_1 /TAXON_ID=312471 /ORGANISM="Neobodo designis, Strain CCAP 1951/1" /LENGTH=368 /DNA_ID=CAMNT_0016116243 /DNA_START=53 /DNA_END=1159 /DNA_ORIENTATION=+